MSPQRSAAARTRADEKRRPGRTRGGKVDERAGPLARIRRFLGRVRAVRKGLNIHWHLAPEPTTTPTATRPAANAAAHSADPVAQEVRQIRRQLRQRLDRHALARTVFAQLVIVERELGRHGYPVLRSLPVELLHAALEQLTCIVGPAPGELATLRSKLLDAILARQHNAGDFSNALSVFDAPHKLETREAGESSFLQAEQEWTQAWTRQRAAASTR